MTVGLNIELPDEAFEKHVVEYRGGGSGVELTDRANAIRHAKMKEAVALMKAQANGVGEPAVFISEYPRQVQVRWENARLLVGFVCLACGGDTLQHHLKPGLALCALSVTGRDCIERVHAHLEHLKPGVVWNDDDYRVAIDAVAGLTVQAEPSTP